MVLLFRGGSGRNSNQEDRKSAREILDERFANGEIEQGEYEERKKVLAWDRKEFFEKSDYFWAAVGINCEDSCRLAVNHD